VRVDMRIQKNASGHTCVYITALVFH
jgi:hypothetical protein